MARLSSLNELRLSLTDDVRQHLESQYDDGKTTDHFQRILDAMKIAPRVTTCRVNRILATTDEVVSQLREILLERGKQREDVKICNFSIRKHEAFDDVVVISPEDARNRLSGLRTPPIGLQNDNSGSKQMFGKGKSQSERGPWPMNNCVIICDRRCGEAVLRGSDIFVRGVICADQGVKEGDEVAVYADLQESATTRGLMLEKYTGHCVFLGLGTAKCSRAEMFGRSKGVGVEMYKRAGPDHPPLNSVLTGKMMLQNIPSILVGHALEPQIGDTILDMCSAPGGKASHVASLVKNNALIIACDKSRRKMVTAKKFFNEMGTSCIVPLALDATNCVVQDDTSWRSPKEIISSATPSRKDGLLDVKAFYPESFDRIILDPPCSALGLRPRLHIDAQSLPDLLRHADYQRAFIRKAVALLKPGGTMTYSTCTINASENEKMVRLILDENKCMTLVPIKSSCGLPGLSGFGLNQEEASFVRRFDPSDEAADTMGFFVAKFIKQRSHSNTFERV